VKVAALVHVAACAAASLELPASNPMRL
jgi:hypothetical protein